MSSDQQKADLRADALLDFFTRIRATLMEGSDQWMNYIQWHAQSAAPTKAAELSKARQKMFEEIDRFTDCLTD